jgi:hypothetical protein
MTAPNTTPALGLPLNDQQKAFLKLDAMASILAGFAPDPDTTVQSTRTFGYRAARYVTDAGAIAKVNAGTIVCTDSAVRFVQWDADNGVTLETSHNPMRFAIARVTCAGGIITEIEDLRDADLHTPNRVRWRGVWSAGAYRRHDAVRHINDVWIATVTTTDIPGAGTDWEIVVYGVPDPSTADDDDALLVYDGELFYGPVTGGGGGPHTHDASDIVSGTIDTARLGSGTADSTTFLRGDQTWATPPTLSPGADLDLIEIGRPWRAVQAIIGSNTPNFFGTGPTHSIQGSASTQTPATTSYRTSRSRIQYTSPAAANNGSGFVSNPIHQYFSLGDAAGVGGFIVAIEFAFATLPSSTRAFYGLTANINAATGGEPSSRVNIIGFGWNTGDTNWQFYTNDGSGTITRVDTGVSIATDVVYRVVVACDDNSSNVSCKLYSVAFSGLTLLDERNPTTELPDGATFLNPIGHVNTSAGSSAIVSDFMFWRGIQK